WCPSENRKRPKTTRVENQRNPLPYKGKRPIGLWFQGPHSVSGGQRAVAGRTGLDQIARHTLRTKRCDRSTSSMTPIPEGISDELITDELASRLTDELLHVRSQLDPAEADRRIAQHVAEVVARAV